MAKLSAFLFLTLNGFFEGPGHDISWHAHEAEAEEYSNESLAAGHALLLGRLTYELMAAWWPTAAAREAYPVTAPGMNAAEKFVFSRTLQRPEWNNTRLLKGDLREEAVRLKETSRTDLTILGSGSIVRQLTEYRLIDRYEFLIDPIALGDGTPVFKGLSRSVALRLASAKPFKNGSILVTYQPAPQG